MKRYLFILSSILFFTQINAQCMLKGTVINKANNKPLKGVIITDFNKSTQTISDKNGFFELKCESVVSGDIPSLIVVKKNFVVIDKKSLFVNKKDSNFIIKLIMQKTKNNRLEIEQTNRIIIENINKVNAKEEQLINITKLQMIHNFQNEQAIENNVKVFQDTLSALNIKLEALAYKKDICLQFLGEIAEQLTFFNPSVASNEAIIANALFRKGEIKAAFDTLHETKLKQTQGLSADLKQKIIADYMLKGNLALALGELEIAKRLFSESVKLDENNVNNLIAFANLLFETSERQNAIFYYNKALFLTKNELIKAILYNKLGNLQKLNRAESSTEMTFIKSLNILEKLVIKYPQKFDEEYALILANFGDYYLQLKECEKSLLYLKKAHNIYKRLSNKRQKLFYFEIANTAMKIGLANQLIKDIAHSEYYLSYASNIYKQLTQKAPNQFEESLATVLFEHGKLKFSINEYDKAAQMFTSALKVREKQLIKGNSIVQGWYDFDLLFLRKIRDSFFIKHNYPKVVELQLIRANSLNEVKYSIDNGIMFSAYEFGALSWYQLFTHKFSSAEESALRALILDPSQVWIKTNLAHALLFQKKDQSAKAIYDELKTQKDKNGNSFRNMLKKDFNDLESAGLNKTQLNKAKHWIEE